MRLIIIISSLLTLFACFTEETNQIQSIKQISNDGKLYSTEDFVAVGFKINKNYDVTDLPGALEVVYGFWKTPNKAPADYEIRLYPSHENALNLGVKFAKERSGDTALLDESDSTWKEDLRESRFCSGPTRSGGGVNCRLAKYNNFYVFSNSIILCQGRNTEESSTNCELLINRLK